MKFDGEKIYQFMREMNRDGHPRQYGEKPMKLKDLSEISKIPYRVLWDIANTGKNGRIRKNSPNVEKAIRIARGLGKTLDDFMN